MAGKVNRAMAPSVRMAAMAVEVSSSSGSMAPCAAMIAVTPQIDEPMASSEVNLGGRWKMRPSTVITESERTSSTATNASDSPPMCRTSCNRKRAPTRTIPSFSHSS